MIIIFIKIETFLFKLKIKMFHFNAESSKKMQEEAFLTVSDYTKYILFSKTGNIFMGLI